MAVNTDNGGQNFTSYYQRLSTGHLTEPQDYHEFMNNQYFRLSTFLTWPTSARAAPSRLAHAGLYYTKNGDEVMCFSCKGKINSWDLGESPLVKHRMLYPHCPFILGLEDRNVNFESTDSQIQTLYDVRNFVNDLRSNRPRSVVGPNVSEESPLQAAANAPILHSLMSDTQLSSKSPENEMRPQLNTSPQQTPSASLQVFPAQESSRDVGRPTTAPPGVASNVEGRVNNSSASSYPRQRLNNLVDFHTPPHRICDLRIEADRLATFANWSSREQVVSAHALAAAGFSYTGIADRVRCAFCDGVLRNWQPGDDAFEEHRRYYPQCPFVRERENVSFMPPSRIDDQYREPASTSTTQHVIVRPIGGNDDAFNSQLGICTERPVHERLAVEAVRLKSFRMWPSQIQQKPKDLAVAGFFYTGFADNVKCFYCDGGLRNWEKADDPWTEHARFFPKCVFLTQIKGQKLIRKIQEEKAAKDAKGDDETTQEGHRDSDVTAAMATTWARAAMEMGYSERDIRVAITRKITSTGTSYSSAEGLVETLIQYQAELRNDQSNVTLTHVPEDRAQSAQQSRGSSQSDDSQLQHAGVSTNAPINFQEGENSRGVKQGDDTSNVNLDQNCSQQKTSEKPAIDMSLLVKEIASLKESLERDRDMRTCKICMEKEANILFLPCGHLVSCSSCAPALRTCPICRDVVRGTVRTFLS